MQHQCETLLTSLDQLLRLDHCVLSGPSGSFEPHFRSPPLINSHSPTAAHQQPLTNSTKAFLTRFCKVRDLQGEIPNVF